MGLMCLFVCLTKSVYGGVSVIMLLIILNPSGKRVEQIFKGRCVSACLCLFDVLYFNTHLFLTSTSITDNSKSSWGES